jgi:hypothetical protein
MSERAAQIQRTEDGCIVVRNEEDFYSYIETRLVNEGFEVLETSPRIGWHSGLAAHAY